MQLGTMHPDPKSHRLSNKNSGARHWKPAFELLVRGAQKIPLTKKAIAIVLGCFPELEGKTLLLKTPCTLDTGLRGICGTDQEPSLRTSSHSAKNGYACFQGRKVINSPTQCNVHKLQQLPPWQDILKGA